MPVDLNTTFGHRPIHIRGEAATTIPHSSNAFIPDRGPARPRGHSDPCLQKNSKMLVCQTYVTPCLMKSWSVSLGDFHPSGRIGKQL